MKIRPSALAGRWFSADAIDLRTSISSYLNAAKMQKLSGVRAIVVPHAGHYWSGPTAAEAYRALDTDKIRRIFILGPNHRVPVRGAVSVSSDAFETPLGLVNVDRSLIDRWCSQGILRIEDGVHRLEHDIEIQLPFIQVIFGEHQPLIVPIIVGETVVEGIQMIAEHLRAEMREDDLLLISTDFLHYGEDYDYVPFGAPVQPQIEAYDARTIAAIARLNGSEFETYAMDMPHAACGIHALRVLAFTFEHTELKAYQLAYDTSGRKSGSDRSSVSYAAIAIAEKQEIEGLNEEFEHGPLTEKGQEVARCIVKRALEEAVKAQHETVYPDDLDLGEEAAVFEKPYGVFVTLKDASDELRGCIGNIVPVSTLAQGLWGRAQDAALNDPRFEAVSEAELSTLTFEISVLTPIVPVGGPGDIEVGRHGVVMRKNGRSAVFLPQVAPEQGWDVPMMLRHLSMKAGLPPVAWKEGASFSVFEAQVF